MLKQETEGVIKYHLNHEFTAANPKWDIVAINTWRTLLYQLKLIGQHADRYMGYGYGNISQRTEGEQFLISGTQTSGIAKLTLENYCLVEATDLASNTLYSSGPCNPSSEALSHASVYQHDKSIQCVIHAHNPDIWHATKDLKLPCIAQGVAYGTPDMAHAINQLFHSGRLKHQSLFTMLGHKDGVFSFGQDFPRAAFTMINTLASARQLK
ncbi:class II aldolase/adducin family protein [Methyloprofundus sp.]|uniref:class II aldolase/adducin family protein n=1 Tax=Methyloprofundus sp. TaxID=2020875 RepID=UPI003D0A8775